jgi:hypothetical protein
MGPQESKRKKVTALAMKEARQIGAYEGERLI